MGQVIECVDLTFGYNSQNLIISELSLSIQRGQFIGIVGPNGSGKSTLLKLLSSVLKPHSGKIFINGKQLSAFNIKELARLMAVVPQSTEVIYDFSVYEIVAMGRYPHQGRWHRETAKDQEIIQQVMKQTGVWEFRNKSIFELSGGEKQRVFIARALAQEPEIILLDEPTSNLDINYQIEIFDLLKELNAQGVTIVSVLHDLNLASQYCDNLVMLHKGKVYADGKPDKVITVKNVKEVYNTDVIISYKYSGRPYITLVSQRKVLAKKSKENLPHIHLICGGGSGRDLINWLLENGFPLTGGILNQGDSDWHLLLQNNCPVVEERPFSPITRQTYEELLSVMERTDIIIVTDLPFGSGNLYNLQAILEFIHKTRPSVYFFGDTPIEDRDFTGGKAIQIYRELINKGAVVIKSIEELRDKLNSLCK